MQIISDRDTATFSKPCSPLYFDVLVGLTSENKFHRVAISSASEDFKRVWSVHVTDGHFQHLQLWRPVKIKISD